jgi:protein-disulfide isomerase
MNRLALPVGPRDHILGPPEAPVTLLEYGDYECPYCGSAHHVVAEVLRNLGKEVRFVFRHFPLSQIHPHALSAAETAEAAGVEGRFWPMHTILFENQDALDIDDLLTCAEGLGLDAVRVAEDLRMGVHLPKVTADFRSGVRSGVNGTPTFFINGERFDGRWDLDTLTVALQRAAQPPLHATR